MLIAKVENETVVSVADYRDLFPNVSFSNSGVSSEFLAENGCFPVSVWKPYDLNTQKLVPCDPYIEGEFVYTVQVEPKTDEELQQQAESKAASVRVYRNALLKDSDWTQVLDAPIDRQAWADYRQALRDIPNQSGFPWTVEWPEQPR